MTVDERLDRPTGIVEALAQSVVAHDSQIEALTAVAAKYQNEMRDLVREWQAYLRRLPQV
jgi:hypothetical protein